MKKEIKTSFGSVKKSMGFLSILAVVVLWLWMKSDSIDSTQKTADVFPNSLSQKSAPHPLTLPKPTVLSLPENLQQGTLGTIGGLRVSNWTQHSVRIVLRKASQTSELSEPVHWDFAPGEGGNQGLLLSLPKASLKLEKGDILMAFAQDGSQVYWGPYPIGDSSIPLWNQETSEWVFILQQN